ncbi:MAG: helix-turn-helix domain-containing protein [Lachnospiraceae bacterium]|nr:helix-turn-helix domain-containing protein [Lachnospiraceae bacterium]
MAKKEWKSDLELTGERIKARRKELHMTQTQLAEELGGSVTNRTISEYECGKHEMGIQTLYDLADVLETTPDQLAPARCSERKGSDPRMDELSRKFASLDEDAKDQAFEWMMSMLEGYAARRK